MFGAIIGDIIGSKFEFDIGPESKEFELFSVNDCFTDDTVMTCAVADALLQAGDKNEIATYIEKEFGYTFDRSLSDIAQNDRDFVDCMHSVPEAITVIEEFNKRTCTRIR
ncbi:MAG: hypothetical protein J6U54_18155 [Clostridiales bacterium]|nr:hypothetical protein [Clostridiales bacterium]